MNRTHVLTQDEFQDAIIALHNRAMEEGGTSDDFTDRENRKRIYKHGMPMLTSRRSVQLYLACAAHGRSAGFLDASELKECLHVAQLSLTAFGQSAGPEPLPLRSLSAVAEGVTAVAGWLARQEVNVG